MITCLAVLLLLSARRSSWPIWAMVLAWLPALLLLSGRMYIRPETLSLLYLSIYLAVLFRWDRFPALAWLLPLVQVAWVNSHGLFILGPWSWSSPSVDAALSPQVPLLRTASGGGGRSCRPAWSPAWLAWSIPTACKERPIPWSWPGR